MTLSKLTIPKKIKVGFQNRGGTYTGQLAYVIYYDAKGKLRSEKSWEGWRDKAIEPVEFDNEPTTGFVLNKKVGDYSSRWGGRRAWIRIYDQRGFEFEISVENLLFLLEHTSAIQGKGLEGEFVLAWGGSGGNSKVMLLPTCSEDYRESSDYTNLQTKKVTKKDMVEGCVYRTKENEDVLYLGRHAYHEMEGYGYNKRMVRNKKHVFVSVDGKSTHWIQKGFTKLAVKLSEEPSPLYADEFENFMNSFHGSQVVEVAGTPAKPVFKDRWSVRGSYYIKRKDGFHRVEFQWERGYGYGYSHRRHQRKKDGWQMRESRDPVKITTDGGFVLPHRESFGEWKNRSVEALEKMEFFSISAKNEQGAVCAI
jgi:hypothetical protein